MASARASLLTGGRVTCGRLGTTCNSASLSRRPRDRPPVVCVRGSNSNGRYLGRSCGLKFEFGFLALKSLLHVVSEYKKIYNI